MKYYVWCDESCDNVTEDLEQARRWEKEFLDEGREAYIVDIDNNIIDERQPGGRNMTKIQPILADREDVLMEDGDQVIIASSIKASDEDAVQVIQSHNRSDWHWIRLANGDLALATYPQEDLYELMSQRPNMV